MKTAILKTTSTLMAAGILCFSLLGCMTDKEYQLRAKQLENQANHPTTYDLFQVQGPIKIEILEGGTAKVTVPNQPFQEVPIPDSIKTQEQLIAHLIDIGAISVLGYKALQDANGSHKTSTTINNYGE